MAFRDGLPVAAQMGLNDVTALHSSMNSHRNRNHNSTKLLRSAHPSCPFSLPVMKSGWDIGYYCTLHPHPPSPGSDKCSSAILFWMRSISTESLNMTVKSFNWKIYEKWFLHPQHFYILSLISHIPFLAMGFRFYCSSDISTSSPIVPSSFPCLQEPLHSTGGRASVISCNN